MELEDDHIALLLKIYKSEKERILASQLPDITLSTESDLYIILNDLIALDLVEFEKADNAYYLTYDGYEEMERLTASTIPEKEPAHGIFKVTKYIIKTLFIGIAAILVWMTMIGISPEPLNEDFLQNLAPRLEFIIDSVKTARASQSPNNNPIICTNQHCSGTYSGPEFINGSDIAHQFSNHMSNAVGDQLKALYKNEQYSRVDFFNIEMSTIGMGSGNVVYQLTIPFVSVDERCDAFTSFDHVGGWNHKPALTARKNQLKGALLEGETFSVSNLKRTAEGLQEYWIQWKNKDVQAICAM